MDSQEVAEMIWGFFADGEPVERRRRAGSDASASGGDAHADSPCGGGRSRMCSEEERGRAIRHLAARSTHWS